jgi:hypothetical protein
MEFPQSSVGRDAFISYQQAKENLASLSAPDGSPSWTGGLLTF